MKLSFSKLPTLPAILFLAGACSSSPFVNFDQVVTKRASYDFNCPEKRIELTPIESDKYVAKGCGAQRAYEVHCSLGPCAAKTIAK